MGGKSVIYWDSCIFLAHVKTEERQNPGDLQGIDELVDLFEKGQIDIATSVISLIEVLQTTITDAQYQKFTKFFSRKNGHLIDVTRDIAEISHTIRYYYYVDGRPTVSVPDCIQLATAINLECECVYTFDGQAERNRPGLLQLSQPLAGKYNMPIQVPSQKNNPQLKLGL